MAAGRGAVGTVVDVSLRTLLRARFLVLGMIALTAAASLIEAVLHAPVRSLVCLAVACAIYLAFATIHLRHGGLGALTAIAPLPGVLAACAVAASRSAETFVLLALGYALAFVMALFLAEDIGAHVVTGASAPDAAIRALRADSRAISGTAAVAALSLVLCFLNRHFAAAFAPAIAVGIIGAMVSVALVLPLGASTLNLDEEFVARANRAGEWRARIWGRLAPATRPRFGWSASGIALVFVVLAFFGAHSLRVLPSARIVAFAALSALALLVFASAFMAMRDWRRAIAVGFALAPAAMTGFWAVARLNLLFGLTTLSGLTLALAIGFGLELFVAIHAGSGLSTEDEVATGSQRALESRGATASAATLAVMLGSIPFCWNRISEGVALDLVVLFAALGAIVFQPAFAIAIESLVPRRSTIDRRYRVQ